FTRAHAKNHSVCHPRSRRGRADCRSYCGYEKWPRRGDHGAAAQTSSPCSWRGARYAGIFRDELQGLACDTRWRNGTLMVDIANRQEKAAAAPQAQSAERKPLPRWVITLASIAIMLILWEIFGRRVNPVFGSYPSAIAVAFWELAVSGQLW